ncbi:high-affinity iron transporter [Tistlia consotensis]|uniref:High-affinity iron transporter n=1 Tax=Tistlia consotensis USBA 355 TaxID=560819 RepID=A0A1Y6BSP3_9PROT|nr:FTR1 family protein [Tistlia consotensis]SMF26624.1 high-affinity iron transporter [Tistlia consotensis USBA 355]SNR66958.1 high-affinity iron transporter [Tistlia consotensis]
MVGSAVIVFREVLEAALIVAIVLGATRGVVGRGRWVGSGILAGLVGASVVAAFASAIADAMAGSGQELFNAAVLLAAVAMLAWHNAWMSAHGKAIASEMRRVGHDVTVGARPLAALGLVTALAVLREGSETVLFLYSLAASGANWSATFAGAAVGLGAGALVGWLLYRGLLAIPLRHFFTAVSWMVLLLASGLAATAAGFLNQAGLVPALGFDVWDTSGILAQDSWLGMLLHILVGYTDRPMGIQIAFYIAALLGILTLMRLVGRTARTEALAEAGATN